MPIEILMPALSPTMTEGNLVNWLKKEGDTIQAGHVLAEIETDKATMEVEAVDEGILGKILIAEGTENVAVNTVIALILEEGEDQSALEGYTTATLSTPSQDSQNESAPSQPAPSPLKTPTAEPAVSISTGRIIASPLAKRIAHHEGIDLQGVVGSGPHGRIIKADVEHALRNPKVSPTSSTQNIVAAYDDIPLSGMRKVIASRLQESKQTIPHFYLSIECEIDQLLKARAHINKDREKEHKISVNDFVVMACAKALRDVPDANVSFHDTYIRRYSTADIAVAVAIEGGLVTPIVRDAGSHALGNLSHTIKELVGKARASKLQPHEFQGGSFCVSNLGMYGIDQFQAIINPPQACILAVGAGVKKPIVDDTDTIRVATIMNCTLSVDHRAVDGALGATFLKSFKRYIEHPINLLV